MNSIKGLLFGLISLGIMSCGSGHISSDQTEEPRARTTSGDARSWIKITEESDSTEVGFVGCENPRKFVVESDGSFVAGPCHIGNSDFARGELLGEEYNELNRRLDVLMTDNFRSQTMCDEGTIMVTHKVDLESSDGIVDRIYERQISRASTCYKGDRLASTLVMQYLNELQRKYYPR